MNQLFPVLKFLFKTDFQPLNEALKVHPAPEVESFTLSQELLSYLPMSKAALIIVAISEKEDLLQLAQLVKGTKKISGETITKFFIIDYTKNGQFDKEISKLGIQEIITPAINAKALRFKIDFAMKSLAGQVAKSGQEKQLPSLKLVENKKSELDSQLDEVVWTAGLDIIDDCWLIRSQVDVRKVLNKWIIDLKGPSPMAGTWVEVKPKTWKFDFKASERAKFVKGMGEWFFTGEQKPEFNWKENKWLIAGAEFEFYFQQGHEKWQRFVLKNKKMTCAKNSPFALAKEQAIHESFENNLIVKNEKEKPTEDLTIQTKKLENLSGDGSTDHLSLKHLKGEGGEEKIDHSPMRGDFNLNDKNNLQGKKLEAIQDAPDGKDLNFKEVDQQNGGARDKNVYLDQNSLDDLFNKFHKEQYVESKAEEEADLQNEPLEFREERRKHPRRTEDFNASEMDDLFSNEEKSESTFEESADLFADDAPEAGSLVDIEKARRAQELEELEFVVSEAIFNCSLIDNDNKVDVKFDDSYDDTASFLISNKLVMVRDRYIVDMSFDFLEKTTHFVVEGEYISCDMIDRQNSLLIIKIDPKHQKSFNQFIKLFNMRQTNINIFFKKVKGY